MNAGLIILALKIAVIAVTVLLGASLFALSRGWYRVHGRINMVFFALTLSALIGLEVVTRRVWPGVMEEYLEHHQATRVLWIHLGFSIPSALLLTVMLFTGLRHRRKLHVGLGIAFLILWVGTFVTGVFYLPHEM
jgi:hypothetical protein